MRDGRSHPGQVALRDRAHRGREKIWLVLIRQREPADRVARARIVPFAERAGDLQTHLRIRVVDQFRDAWTQLGGRLEGRLAEPNGIAANARMLIAKSGFEKSG